MAYLPEKKAVKNSKYFLSFLTIASFTIQSCRKYLQTEVPTKNAKDNCVRV